MQLRYSFDNRWTVCASWCIDVTYRIVAIVYVCIHDTYHKKKQNEKEVIIITNNHAILLVFELAYRLCSGFSANFFSPRESHV